MDIHVNLNQHFTYKIKKLSKYCTLLHFVNKILKVSFAIFFIYTFGENVVAVKIDARWLSGIGQDFTQPFILYACRNLPRYCKWVDKMRIKHA